MRHLGSVAGLDNRGLLCRCFRSHRLRRNSRRTLACLLPTRGGLGRGLGRGWGGLLPSKIASWRRGGQVMVPDRSCRLLRHVEHGGLRCRCHSGCHHHFHGSLIRLLIISHHWLLTDRNGDGIVLLHPLLQLGLIPLDHVIRLILIVVIVVHVVSGPQLVVALQAQRRRGCPGNQPNKGSEFHILRSDKSSLRRAVEFCAPSEGAFGDSRAGRST
mmetsp:Transcript_47239/g.125126  ORF Transcript_47239/g.125126 Transcript_47239/m.125126 type:complete len:215 (+) Transcript_47239:1208-1852(+)